MFIYIIIILFSYVYRFFVYIFVFVSVTGTVVVVLWDSGKQLASRLYNFTFYDVIMTGTLDAVLYGIYCAAK